MHYLAHGATDRIQCSKLARSRTNARKLWSPEGKVLAQCHQNMQSLEFLNIMEFDDARTPDPFDHVSPLQFDLGTLDNVINGVRKIRHSAYANSGFDFSKLDRSVPNSFNSRFDRIEESFSSLSIKVNCLTILFSSFRIVSVFH
jgi:hypothetical protein